MNLTPVAMPIDWVLLIGMVVVALAIAGMIWWHRTHPSVAKKELQDLFASLKTHFPAAAPPTVVTPSPPVVDPLLYNGIQFPNMEALQGYKLAQATLEHYQPKP